MVVNSEGVRDFYVRHGTPADRVRVIPNGVALPARPATTRRQLLAELGLPDGEPAGRIGRAALAAEAGERRHLGGRPAEGDPQRRASAGDRRRPAARPAAAASATRCRIGDKVHFLGERGDVPRLLPHFDLLWSTSGYEGQSNVILEAMAAGVPVVATDIPGTRELVLPEATGYLVPVGNRAAFAKYAERLLNDPALAARLSPPPASASRASSASGR